MSGDPRDTETSKHMRRSLRLAGAFAVGGFVVTLLLGHPLAGVFFGVGLAMGMVSSLFLQKALVAFIRRDGEVPRGALIGSMLRRLAAVTAIAMVLVVIFRPDGIGVLAGLAVYQMLIVGPASGTLLREVRGA